MTDSLMPPNSEPAIRIIAMPADTNPSGDIFGGWLMSMMDMAGATVAYQRAGGRVATVAVDEIEFHSPVLVGDLVTCYAEIIRTGQTSLATKVDVWVRGRSGGEPIKVTEGVFTFVAIDDDRVPRPLPAE
ncbi:MAG: acyl-CoA thioesterase [Rhodospirillaceae bacterium]|nr:acyl-CoA thioesterase [Rhodospirillaceae bacterium]MBT5455899.1 acyl-CoA thioesterase [Rhodospirillaceae bacterium]